MAEKLVFAYLFLFQRVPLVPQDLFVDPGSDERVAATTHSFQLAYAEWAGLVNEERESEEREERGRLRPVPPREAAHRLWLRALGNSTARTITHAQAEQRCSEKRESASHTCLPKKWNSMGNLRFLVDPTAKALLPQQTRCNQSVITF